MPCLCLWRICNQTPLFCLSLWKLSVFELHLFLIFIPFYPEANLQLVLLSKINVSTWQISFWRGCACTFPTFLFIRHGSPRFYNKEVKSEAARKEGLLQEFEIKSEVEAGERFGLSEFTKPKILQNIKSGQQLHNSIGLFHYSLNELLDDSSQS